MDIKNTVLQINNFVTEQHKILEADRKAALNEIEALMVRNGLPNLSISVLRPRVLRVLNNQMSQKRFQKTVEVLMRVSEETIQKAVPDLLEFLEETKEKLSHIKFHPVVSPFSEYVELITEKIDKLEGYIQESLEEKDDF